MFTEPTSKNISLLIPPNYSTWQTIELTYQACQDVIKRNVEGVFVECGIAAGNNFAAMCLAGRHGYGFDSFEGIPWAGPKDTEQPGIGNKTVELEWINGIPVKSYIGGGFVDNTISSGVTVHTMDNVMKDMEKYGIKNYSLIKGWFINTLPTWNLPISVLRLDGDLYSSTYESLTYLWPHLSEGGILIVDDWNLEGCRLAFDEYFLNNYGKHYRPQLILNNGVTYWKK